MKRTSKNERMKKIVRLFLLSLISIQSITAFSQTAKEVFNNSETKLLYLGIDFTKARLIGDAAANEVDIRDRQFAAINDVVVNEPKRYEINAAFNRSEIENDLSLVAKRNEKIKAEEIKSTSAADFNRLKESDINSIVKGYDFGNKAGVGILLVMEGMSKGEKAASIWVTLVDMKSKKVLMTERVESKTSAGFSFRNYWASSIRNLLESIDKKKYNEWKQKYS
ncbi:hypothetical protein [Flavitalea sp.]|nr:hypothetical protein [Flavitalea sp.]